MGGGAAPAPARRPTDLLILHRRPANVFARLDACASARRDPSHAFKAATGPPARRAGAPAPRPRRPAVLVPHRRLPRPDADARARRSRADRVRRCSRGRSLRNRRLRHDGARPRACALTHERRGGSLVKAKIFADEPQVVPRVRSRSRSSSIMDDTIDPAQPGDRPLGARVDGERLRLALRGADAHRRTGRLLRRQARLRRRLARLYALVSRLAHSATRSIGARTAGAALMLPGDAVDNSPRTLPRRTDTAWRSASGPASPRWPRDAPAHHRRHQCGGAGSSS